MTGFQNDHGGTPSEADGHQVFPGDSEMAGRCRTLDWTATPLGPLEEWPGSLRTVACVCVTSPLPMSVWWGRELTLIYNDGYRDVLGDGRHPAALGRPGPAVWPEIPKALSFRRVLSGGVPTWLEDQPLRIRGEEERHFTYSLSPIPDGSGGVGGVLNVVVETTGRVRAERTLARMVESERVARREAEDANRARSQFLSTMSHELRTPLNAIGGYVELLEMGVQGPLTEAQREALARIRTSEERLLELIDAVLRFARLDREGLDYEVTEVRVVDALALMRELSAPEVEGRGLRVSVGQCPDDLTVLADPEKLRQILVNLLANAMKFSKSGGRVEVTCDAEGEEGEEVRLRVRDTGIGIPPDELETIFEPFVQVRADLTRTAEGTGLGLAISRGLARGMDGDLTVQSEEGAGSTFTLTLPRAPTE